VLRHSPPGAAAAILQPVLDDRVGGWRLPERAQTTVDRDYVLAAAGLLAADHPDAAASLLTVNVLKAARAG
jgi:hypothetical protein